jgi:hypothetical protein
LCRDPILQSFHERIKNNNKKEKTFLQNPKLGIIEAYPVTY